MAFFVCIISDLSEGRVHELACWMLSIPFATLFPPLFCLPEDGSCFVYLQWLNSFFFFLVLLVLPPRRGAIHGPCETVAPCHQANSAMSLDRTIDVSRMR